MRYGNADIVVLPRSAGHDVYGDLAAPTGVGHTIEGCAVAPAESVEQAGTREHGTVRRLQVLCPPGSDLLATDRVTVTDYPGTWEVDGDPQVWKSGTADVTRGVQAFLRRAVA